MAAIKVRKKSRSVILKIALACFAALLVVILSPGLLKFDVSQATDSGKHGPKFCSKTAMAALRACKNEVEDDYWIAVGNCINVSDAEEREECYTEARAERKEGKELCKEQFEARLEVCDLVGEKRYDPHFVPENFLRIPTGNNYFPLGVGNKWVYVGTFEDDEGEEVTETTTVEVLRATKLIEGVTCIVVNDVVEEDGEVIEDTDDWYAQHVETNDIWYCGEIAKNFETFVGDRPEEPELVDIDGSWKAGRDGAKPGILIQADPQPGYAYRQEVLLGEAEDVAQVISDDYVYGKNPDLDSLVPEDLATLLCKDTPDGKCVVTRDLTALEPGVEERKYYAPGIGVFLEVNLETGDIVQLVSCTTCPILPAP